MTETEQEWRVETLDGHELPLLGGVDAQGPVTFGLSTPEAQFPTENALGHVFSRKGPSMVSMRDVLRVYQGDEQILEGRLFEAEDDYLLEKGEEIQRKAKLTVKARPHVLTKRYTGRDRFIGDSDREILRHLLQIDVLQRELFENEDDLDQLSSTEILDGELRLKKQNDGAFPSSGSAIINTRQLKGPGNRAKAAQVNLVKSNDETVEVMEDDLETDVIDEANSSGDSTEEEGIVHAQDRTETGSDDFSDATQAALLDGCKIESGTLQAADQHPIDDDFNDGTLQGWSSTTESDVSNPGSDLRINDGAVEKSFSPTLLNGTVEAVVDPDSFVMFTGLNKKDNPVFMGEVDSDGDVYLWTPPSNGSTTPISIGWSRNLVGSLSGAFPRKVRFHWDVSESGEEVIEAYDGSTLLGSVQTAGEVSDGVEKMQVGACVEVFDPTQFPNEWETNQDNATLETGNIRLEDGSESDYAWLRTPSSDIGFRRVDADPELDSNWRTETPMGLGLVDDRTADFQGAADLAGYMEFRPDWFRLVAEWSDGSEEIDGASETAYPMDGVIIDSRQSDERVVVDGNESHIDTAKAIAGLELRRECVLKAPDLSDAHIALTTGTELESSGSPDTKVDDVKVYGGATEPTLDTDWVFESTFYNVTYTPRKAAISLTKTVPAGTSLTRKVSFDGGDTFKTISESETLYFEPSLRGEDIVVRLEADGDGTDSPSVDDYSLDITNGWNTGTHDFESTQRNSETFTPEETSADADVVVPTGASVFLFVSLDGGTTYTEFDPSGETKSIPSSEISDPPDVRWKVEGDNPGEDTTWKVSRVKIKNIASPGTTTVTPKVSTDDGGTFHQVKTWQDDLELFWKLTQETGSSVVDETGNGRDGTAQGSASLDQGGKFDSGADLPGAAGDYLSSDSSFDVGSSEQSLTVWVNPDVDYTGPANQAWLVHHRQDASNRVGAYISTSGDLTAHLQVGGSSTEATADGNPLTKDAWDHVAVVATSSRLELWVDGSLEAETSHSLDPASIGAGTLYVGHRDGSATDYTIDAQVDEANVWSRRLREDSIQILARAELEENMILLGQFENEGKRGLTAKLELSTTDTGITPLVDTLRATWYCDGYDDIKLGDVNTRIQSLRMDLLHMRTMRALKHLVKATGATIRFRLDPSDGAYYIDYDFSTTTHDLDDDIPTRIKDRVTDTKRDRVKVVG